MRQDVEWHVAFPLPDLPMDKTIYRGPDEVRSLWAAFSSVWDELTVSVEEVVERARTRWSSARASSAGRAAAA